MGSWIMYLVNNAHEAIIDRETFDQVQEMKGHIKDTVANLTTALMENNLNV